MTSPRFSIRTGNARMTFLANRMDEIRSNAKDKKTEPKAAATLSERKQNLFLKKRARIKT